MRLGYTIAFVPNAAESMAFFEKAFGLKQKFLVPTGDYGELETGATTLGFASHDFVAANLLKEGYVRASESPQPLGVEIALVTDDVATAHKKALAAGAKELAPPAPKPWGQTVSYVRCPDGTLIELCTPAQPPPSA
jgi:lactoylglutathione lyase